MITRTGMGRVVGKNEDVRGERKDGGREPHTPGVCVGWSAGLPVTKLKRRNKTLGSTRRHSCVRSLESCWGSGGEEFTKLARDSDKHHFLTNRERVTKLKAKMVQKKKKGVLI